MKAKRKRRRRMFEYMQVKELTSLGYTPTEIAEALEIPVYRVLVNLGWKDITKVK